MLFFWTLLQTVRLCLCSRVQTLCTQCLPPKPFPCALLKATDPFLTPTAVLFLCFSLSLCHTNLQNQRGTLLSQNLGWTPLPMRQHVPVFQLAAAVVTALSHREVWLFPTIILKNPFQSCWTWNAINHIYRGKDQEAFSTTTWLPDGWMTSYWLKCLLYAAKAAVSAQTIYALFKVSIKRCLAHR